MTGHVAGFLDLNSTCTCPTMYRNCSERS